MERLTGPLIFTSPLSEPEDSLNGKHAMKELASDYFSQSSGENTIDRRGFLKCAVLAGSTGKGDHPHRDAVNVDLIFGVQNRQEDFRSHRGRSNCERSSRSILPVRNL